MNSQPLIDMAATGNNIDQLRRKAGLSVRDIQQAVGFNTPQAVYKWLHGVSLPQIDNLIILASLLNVTLDDLIICSKK